MIGINNCHRHDFNEWRKSMEANGVKFYDSPPDGCDSTFKVGDIVRFTNDYGVQFEPFTVLAFSDPDHGRFIHINSSSYWFPVRADQLTKIK